MSEVNLTVMEVSKIEVSKIREIERDNGHFFYVADIHIRSNETLYDITPSQKTLNKLSRFRQNERFSGEAELTTSIQVYSDTREALKVKLDAFK